MPAPPRLGRRFLRTLPWAVFEGGTSVVSGLLTTFVIGRTLESGDVGRATLAISIVVLVEVASAAGIQDAVVRTRSIHTSLIDSAFWAAVLLSLVGMAACYLSALVLARAYGDDLVVPLTMVASTSLLFNALIAVPSAVLTRKMRAAALARRLAVGKFAVLVVLVPLALAHTGAWSIVISYAAGSLCAAAIITATTARRPRLRIHVHELRGLLGFGGLLSLEALLWTAATRLFGIIFGYFHGLNEYGAFQFALRLVDDLATLVQRTVLRFSLSYFSALTRSNTDMRGAFYKGSRLLTVLGAPIFAGIALTAPDLVVVLFGAKWLLAVPLIQIVAVSWIFGFPRSLVGPVLRANGKQAVLVHYALATSTFMIAGAFVTANMSATAATVAFCLRQLFAVPWGLRVIKRNIGISVREQLASMQSAAIATAVLTASVLAIQLLLAHHAASERLAASVAIGAIAYVGTVLIVAPDLRTMALAAGRQLSRRLGTGSRPA